MENKISLNENEWKLKGYWPYVPFLGKSMELGNELMGVTDWVNATVPGGVQRDLMNAGILEDPYFEQNSLKCEWVENRWWMYKTKFSLNAELQSKQFTLVFQGIDYKAHIFLNGNKLGEHEGMFESVSFDITQLVNFDEENDLRILLENAPDEMAQIGYTSLTHTQKSRFGYKWDFGTRLVNIGIWDDVFIKITEHVTLKDTFIQTNQADEKSSIDIDACFLAAPGESCLIKASIEFEGQIVHSYEQEIEFIEETFQFKQKFEIGNPQLWYPNGSGNQPLYKVIIRAVVRNTISDEKVFHVGIRKLEYKLNQDSPPESLPYTLVINGSPVYIKGVNLVPFDHLYGCVSKETYERYILLIKQANINMVRVWGGGIIEKEYFYHLCDLHGIMVWQEFIQSSSGIDNVPSTDPHFLNLLKATAIHAVKLKRNHPCHVIWSGGNELTDEKQTPITIHHPNIAMLKSVVEVLDPSKLFLPSSASGPNEFLMTEQKGQNHDVHGSWKYGGIEGHYSIYNASDSLLHSEFGMDGCSSFSGLQRFLNPENLVVTDMKKNQVWRHHGEWWDTLKRDKTIFGDFNSLEQFIQASQFIQSEGLRYIVESNRRRKFNNSGSIVWQFNEPWPNVSNTCLVEYSRTPKMAYYWLRQAYAPVHVSLVYESLICSINKSFIGEVHVHNSSAEQHVTIRWETLDECGNKLFHEERTIILEANKSSKIADLKYKVPVTSKGVFFVRLSAIDAYGDLLSNNLYVFSQLETEPFAPLLQFTKGQLNIESIEEGFLLKNEGSEVCLFVHGTAIDTTDVQFTNNYISLFPGEEAVFLPQFIAANQQHRVQQLNCQWNYFNKSSLDDLQAVSHAYIENL